MKEEDYDIEERLKELRNERNNLNEKSIKIQKEIDELEFFKNNIDISTLDKLIGKTIIINGKSGDIFSGVCKGYSRLSYGIRIEFKNLISISLDPKYATIDLDEDSIDISFGDVCLVREIYEEEKESIINKITNRAKSILYLK